MLRYERVILPSKSLNKYHQRCNFQHDVNAHVVTADFSHHWVGMRYICAKKMLHGLCSPIEIYPFYFLSDSLKPSVKSICSEFTETFAENISRHWGNLFAMTILSL